MPMIRAYSREGRYAQARQVIASRCLPPFARRTAVVAPVAAPAAAAPLAALMGSLPPRSAAAPAFAAMNQANDYSFNAADTGFTADPHITVQDKGTLIYGTEP